MTLRERLRRAEQRLASLRDQRAHARKTYGEASEALASAPEDAGEDHETFQAAKAAREALEAVDAEIELAMIQQTELLRMLSAEQRPGDADNDAGSDAPDAASLAVAQLARPGEDTLSVVHNQLSRIVRGDEAQALSRLAHGRTPLGRVGLGQLASREQFAVIARADLAGLVQPDRRGLIEPTQRALTFLDFLPFAGTDSNSVQYVRATTLPSDAAAVAPTEEGALKPEMSPLVFDDEDAPIRTIAAWTKQLKQILADAPFLEGLLRTLLVYEVRRSLLGQIIAGNGVGQNILGLLNVPNLGTHVRAAGETMADAILQGIVDVQEADREPEVVLLNPRDIASIRLLKDADGNYQFGPPSQSGATTIWGYPMIAERSLPIGTALVADPAGALGLLRSGVDVLVSDSDQDDFIRNRVTLLAELRAGLAVLRPDAFSKVTITAPV